jgi:Na+-driven multidrug efflux pump
MAVGAMTILTSVMQFAMLPMQGIGQGAQPIMSFNYGAGDADRVRKTYRLLLTVSLSYSLVIWACIMLVPQIFAGIFTPDKILQAFTSRALRIYCAGLGLFGIQIACQMAFVSLGNALCSMTVAIMRKFVLLLPLIYLMPTLVANKTMGVYMAEPVADVLAVTFTAILFFFVFRKAMAKLDAKKLAQ